MAKIVRKELEQKLAALDGAEWDSMSESDDEGSDGDGDELQPPPVPLRAQQKKSKSKQKGKDVASVVPVGPAGEPSGVVYIGHIPHGFYEEAMNGFFKQFGDVIRVRISRSKKSARCKGYAYVEFVSPEVAQIVAETMNGYFLFDKQLVCRVLRFDEIHPNLFDGAGVKFRKVNWHGLYRQKYNADRTPEKDEKHTRKLLKKDKAKKDKLAKLGIEYDFPGFVATLKDRQVAKGPFQESGRNDKNRNRKTPKATKGQAKIDGASDGKDVEVGKAGSAVVEADTGAEGASPSGAAKSPTRKSPATPAGAAAAAAVAKSVKKGKGGEGVKTPTKKSNPSPAKDAQKEEQDKAAVTPSAAGGKGGKSPGSGKGTSGKKKGPKTPEAAASTGAVGSDGKGKKHTPKSSKLSKSPKHGGGGGKGKKRSLEEAQVAAAAAATPTIAAVTSSPGSGKRAKSAKRSRA